MQIESHENQPVTKENKDKEAGSSISASKSFENLSSYNLGPKVALAPSNLKKKEDPEDEGNLDMSCTTPSPKPLVGNSNPRVSVKSRKAKYENSMKHKRERR